MDPFLYLYLVIVAVLGTWLLWERALRPALLAHGYIREDDELDDDDDELEDEEPEAPARAPAPVSMPSVSYFAPPPVMSAPPAAADDADGRTDGRTDAGTSAVPWPYLNLEVDRTQEAVILALLAAGWKTVDIRAVLKGGNDAIGAAIKAAEARLAEDPPALEPEEPELIPINRGRLGAVEKNW